jgi:hypothetical protein
VYFNDVASTRLRFSGTSGSRKPGGLTLFHHEVAIVTRFPLHHCQPNAVSEVESMVRRHGSPADSIDIASCRKKPLLRGWPPPPAREEPPLHTHLSQGATQAAPPCGYRRLLCQSDSATLAIATAAHAIQHPKWSCGRECPTSNIPRPVADVKLPCHAPRKQVYARWKL